MTDAEFEILDELYFVKSFDDLTKIFQYEIFSLEEELWSLIAKGWVKIIDTEDQEIRLGKEQYSNQKFNLRFNATKQGLTAHNQI